MSHKDVRTVFMYSGQGSQYYGMGQELYQHEPVFREAMQRCSKAAGLTGPTLVEKLYHTDNPHGEFSDIRYTHPAIFSFQYSLTVLLQSKGIQPDALIGYSLGEIVAAVVAGMLSFEEGMKLVMQQARLLHESYSEGGMLVVLGSLQELEPLGILEFATLAAENYPGNFVLSGDSNHLMSLRDRLFENYEVSSVMLPVKYAFHSSAIDFLKSHMLRMLKGTAFSAPSIPVYACSVADEVGEVTAAYFWNVARGKIRCQELLQQMISRPDHQFIDVGATGSMAAFFRNGFSQPVKAYTAVNQFGQNLKTLNKLLSDIMAHV